MGMYSFEGVCRPDGTGWQLVASFNCVTGAQESDVGATWKSSYGRNTYQDHQASLPLAELIKSFVDAFHPYRLDNSL